jgi:hypothetical protein
MPATFTHVAEVPIRESPDGRVHVFAGGLLDAQSNAPHFSELLGADLELYPQRTLEIP